MELFVGNSEFLEEFLNAYPGEFLEAQNEYLEKFVEEYLKQFFQWLTSWF